MSVRIAAARLLVGLAVAAAAVSFSWAGEVCVVRDAHFKNGATLYDPREGAGHNKIGELKGEAKEAGAPTWGISQWNTHSPFTGTPQPAANDPRFVKYESGSKEVVFGRDRTMFADVALRLDTSREYRNGVRDPKQRWSALYLWQRIDQGPSFAELQHARFSMDARLLFSKNLHPPGSFDPRGNAAQFTVFVTLQNINKSSADFGRYVWFGIPIYDNRFELSPHREQIDAFTQRPIYLVDEALVARGSIKSGRWIHFAADLADEMKTAVGRAIEKGSMANTALSDVFIRSVNVGWEIPGTFDASMQIKDISICLE
jgi:hypothetical protein